MKEPPKQHFILGSQGIWEPELLEVDGSCDVPFFVPVCWWFLQIDLFGSGKTMKNRERDPKSANRTK